MFVGGREMQVAKQWISCRRVSDSVVEDSNLISAQLAPCHGRILAQYSNVTVLLVGCVG